MADGLGEIAELGALAEVDTLVRSRSTWTAALPGSMASSNGQAGC